MSYRDGEGCAGEVDDVWIRTYIYYPADDVPAALQPAVERLGPLWRGEGLCPSQSPFLLFSVSEAILVYLSLPAVFVRLFVRSLLFGPFSLLSTSLFPSDLTLMLMSLQRHSWP